VDGQRGGRFAPLEVILDSGGSNGGVGVISSVLHHHRRNGLWKQKGVVRLYSVAAKLDDDVVAFSEG
jgi:hypothetical protein